MIQDTLKKIKALEKENEELKRQQKKFDLEKDKMISQNSSLFEELQKSNKNLDSIKNALLNHLSAAQVDRIIYNKNSRWSDTDINTAIALLALGKKSFVFMRDEMKIPLPSVRTVKRYLSKIDLRPGTILSTVELMSFEGKKMSRLQKISAACFDEVMVKQKYVYDSSHDIVVAPKRSMQVVFLRGIFDNWKEPIFFDFDRPMTATLIEELLRTLHKAGFEVVCLDCDMGRSNETCYTSLGATPDKPYFAHPVSNEPVFCIFDAPHLLKLGRNHLLDRGYDFAPGTGSPKRVATVDPLFELIKLTKVDIPAHKVTLSHLIVKGPDRQNVKLASQVCSGKTSLALDKAGCLGELKSHNYKVSIYFI